MVTNEEIIFRMVSETFGETILLYVRYGNAFWWISDFHFPVTITKQW